MSILSGPRAVARAAKVLAENPKLVPLALLPALVAFVLSILGIWAAIAWADDLFLWVLPPPDGAILGFFHAILGWFVTVFAALFSVVITPWLVMLVGFPLCEPLAQGVDAALGGKDVEGTFFGEILLGLTTSLGVVAVGLAGALALFFVGLVPGLALLTGPFTALVWTPFFLAFDACDSSLSRRQYTFRRKLELLTADIPGAISLGLCAAALVAIPVVNLVGLPMVVAAGVVFVREHEGEPGGG